MDQNQLNQQNQTPQNAERSPSPSKEEVVPTTTPSIDPQVISEVPQQETPTEPKIISGKEFLQQQSLKPLAKPEEIDKILQETIKETGVIKENKGKDILGFLKSLKKNVAETGFVKTTSTPNLLNESPVNAVVEKHHLTVSTVAKVLVIAIQATFILLLGFNTKTVSDISVLEKEVKALETQLNNKQNTINIINETIDKTDKLKGLQENEIDLGGKLKVAIDNTPSRVLILETDITPEVFEMVIETSSPLDASLLMSSYINNNVAQQIVLKSASLSRATGKFLTTLEVTFK